MKRTVFVLGAGASYEFNLPLGSGLRDMIVNILRDHLANEDAVTGSGNHFATACRDTGIPIPELITAGEIIRAGLAFTNSIDDFLSANSERPEVIEVGRLAIAAAVLEAEGRSGSHIAMDQPTVDGRRGAVGILDTWLGRLFMAGRGVLRPDDADKIFCNASFIVFNYDRCLEQFLLWAFQDAFSLPQGDVLNIVSNIPIEHVYGSLGLLPRLAHDAAVVPYAATDADLKSVAAGIRTYSEEAQNDAIYARIESLMAEAERVIFLGYAFHAQGLQILYPNGPRFGQMVMGTTMNLSAEAANRANSLASNAGSQLANTDCRNFIADRLKYILEG